MSLRKFFSFFFKVVIGAGALAVMVPLTPVMLVLFVLSELGGDVLRKFRRARHIRRTAKQAEACLSPKGIHQ